MQITITNSIAMSLIKHHGLQSAVAKELGMNRGTLRKFINNKWEYYHLADGSHFRQCNDKGTN